MRPSLTAWRAMAAAAVPVPAVKKSSSRSWEASVLPAAVGFQCGCIGQQSYKLHACHQPHREQGSGEGRHGLTER